MGKPINHYSRLKICVVYGIFIFNLGQIVFVYQKSLKQSLKIVFLSTKSFFEFFTFSEVREKNRTLCTLSISEKYL